MNPVNEHGDMIAMTAYRKLEADLYDQIYDLQFENAGLRVELEQQAIVNGKGSEREAALLAKLEQLKRETAALREQIDDWDNAALHALDHRSDEQHCTCVPPLLWKMKQLERKYAALEKLIIKVGYIITTFDGEMALCRNPWHQPKEEQP